MTLLTSPQEFYTKLLEMIKRAKRRIIISSLYIGAEESELVSSVVVFWHTAHSSGRSGTGRIEKSTSASSDDHPGLPPSDPLISINEL